MKISAKKLLIAYLIIIIAIFTHRMSPSFRTKGLENRILCCAVLFP